MSSLLEWRDATSGDRGPLDQFTCTEAKRVRVRGGVDWKSVTPNWWELTVQSSIRNETPPMAPPFYMRLGLLDGAIAAVSVFEVVDRGSEVQLHAMAIALDLQRKGGGYADEMFRDTLGVITAIADDSGQLESRIVGLIWQGNHKSQEMCRRHGLQHTEEEDGFPGWQVWSRKLPIAL